MRGGVIINAVMPPGTAGSELINNLQSISYQTAFIFININGASTVRYTDRNQSVLDTGLGHRILHLGGNIHNLPVAVSSHTKAYYRHLNGSTPWRRRRRPNRFQPQLELLPTLVLVNLWGEADINGAAALDPGGLAAHPKANTFYW